MEMQFNIGATLDIATSDELAEGLTGLKRDLLGRATPKPMFSTRVGSVIMPTANPTETYIDLGSPPVGRLWNILGINLVGSTPYTSVANAVATVYCGDSDTPSIVGVKYTGLAVPSTQIVSDEVLWCQASDNLVVGISGAVASGQQITALIHIAEWREIDMIANSGK